MCRLCHCHCYYHAMSEAGSGRPSRPRRLASNKYIGTG